mmetsp:Transcript_25341/g.37252  ORF Transcript_25341/g.37252 Transcript_25341/m.37252 type:complete len:376 (-) Transcript_25341:54-1181(-)
MGNTLDGCCKCQDGTIPLKPKSRTEAEEMMHQWSTNTTDIRKRELPHRLKPSPFLNEQYAKTTSHSHGPAGPGNSSGSHLPPSGGGGWFALPNSEGLAHHTPGVSSRQYTQSKQQAIRFGGENGGGEQNNIYTSKNNISACPHISDIRAQTFTQYNAMKLKMSQMIASAQSARQSLENEVISPEPHNIHTHIRSAGYTQRTSLDSVPESGNPTHPAANPLKPNGSLSLSHTPWTSSSGILSVPAHIVYVSPSHPPSSVTSQEQVLLDSRERQRARERERESERERERAKQGIHEQGTSEGKGEGKREEWGNAYGEGKQVERSPSPSLLSLSARQNRCDRMRYVSSPSPRPQEPDTHTTASSSLAKGDRGWQWGQE